MGINEVKQIESHASKQICEQIYMDVGSENGRVQFVKRSANSTHGTGLHPTSNVANKATIL